MISGAMPKWQQHGHRAPLVAVALFGVLIWWGFHTAPYQPRGRNGFAIICLIVFGLSLIAGVSWFWKRLIKEFNYDGRTLMFSTLASPEMQVRDLSAIEDRRVGRAGRPAGILHKVPRRREALPAVRCIQRGRVGGRACVTILDPPLLTGSRR